MSQQIEKAGYVALVGKPNVGKSTLLNQILGKKISITSNKPQTTRQRLIGIKTLGQSQLVFMDTPGIHVSAERELNRYMNRVAIAALHEVDVILWLVSAGEFDGDDQKVLGLLKKVNVPVVLAINKVDLIKDKLKLLPVIASRSEHYDFEDVVPISAKKNAQLDQLQQVLVGYLPPSEHFYPPEQFSLQADRFVATEFIREKCMRKLGQELPYLLTVTIDIMEDEDDLLMIAAVIWVDRESHKPIVIGHKGSKIKSVGIEAREDLERYFNKKVCVKLWVKVKSGWSDSKDMMNRMGYDS